MSSTAVDKLSKGEVQQLALSYAAFVLGSAGAKVDAGSLQSVLDAAGIQVDKAWVTQFGKILSSRPIDSFYSVGGGASEGAPAAPAKDDKKKDEKKDDKKDAKKEAKKEAPPPPPADDDAGLDMGGLFD